MQANCIKQKIKKVWLAWSSGKDSAFTLFRLLKDKEFCVVSLLTTITSDHERISMHSTRKELLQLQASRLNLPLKIIEIPKNCSDKLYDNQMSLAVTEAESLGINYIAFGDLFLRSVRRYREEQLQNTRIKPVFPLWCENTTQLSKNFIDGGFKAKVIAIDKTKIQKDLLGCEYDANFLEQLPPNIDLCGENGEFHTFVYDAPMFSSQINCALGRTVEHDNIAYIDILPASD